MTMLRLYGRVLGLLGPQTWLGIVLALANVALAGAQLATGTAPATWIAGSSPAMTWCLLTAGGEEILEQRSGARPADAADRLGRMMAGRLGIETRAVLNGAPFRV